MSVRPVGIVMTPVEAKEAQGVTIHRTIGSDKLILLDPFLLLDHMTADAAAGAAQEIGFPLHPHRGIETLTYVWKGRVHHRDSMGNEDSVGPGGSQWMTAGGGLFHSEMMEVGDEGTHQGLQIWFNLPAAEKMKPPAYRAARPEEVPEVTLDGGATVRVVAGTVGGVTGPFEGIAVRPTYLDVRLPEGGASVSLPAPPGYSAFAYVVAGRVAFGDEGKKATEAHLAIFGDGDGVTARNDGHDEARFIFVSAKPLGEPVLQYRSLVLSNVDQMKQALDDLENGTFAKTA